MFTNIYSLLIDKDGRACRNISIQFPYVFVCLSFNDLFNFWYRSEQEVQSIQHQLSHKNLNKNNSSLKENNWGDAIIVLEEVLESQEETSQSVAKWKNQRQFQKNI